MKNLLLVFLLTTLVSCKTVATKNNDESIENPNQHIAMAATLASFYCELQRWPKDITELESYSVAEKLPLPTELDWTALKNPLTSFQIGETVTLRIPKEVIETSGKAVSSINSAPTCNGKNVKANVHINIGN